MVIQKQKTQTHNTTNKRNTLQCIQHTNTQAPNSKHTKFYYSGQNEESEITRKELQLRHQIPKLSSDNSLNAYRRRLITEHPFNITVSPIGFGVMFFDVGPLSAALEYVLQTSNGCPQLHLLDFQNILGWKLAKALCPMTN